MHQVAGMAVCVGLSVRWSVIARLGVLLRTAHGARARPAETGGAPQRPRPGRAVGVCDTGREGACQVCGRRGTSSCRGVLLGRRPLGPRAGSAGLLPPVSPVGTAHRWRGGALAQPGGRAVPFLAVLVRVPGATSWTSDCYRGPRARCGFFALRRASGAWPARALPGHGLHGPRWGRGDPSERSERRWGPDERSEAG